MAATLVASFTVFTTSAQAAHGNAELPGSNFEIDDDANLRVDDAGHLDWANVTQVSGIDVATGQNDDSYKGGVKEDTVCPAETTGSIPNNKSDLLTFETWTEPGSGSHPGFFNFAWSRVSDPSGTTLMDFEFNQSDQPCAQGPNFQRTVGDLLVEYAIDQGGARADISVRRWTGSQWGPSEDLDDGTECDGGPCAVGTINQSVIPAAESDTLNAEKQARTFGEAQLDLRFIFDDESCVSFGTAMVKSRSSDAFTSQLKDFIRPVPVNLTNCGRVIVRKVTIPAGEAGDFDFTKSFGTDPSTGNTFSLSHGESQTYNNVLFGTGYTVAETGQADGFEFDSVDCGASTGVTPSDITGAVVTFDIDASTDVLDCTFYNRALARLTFEKQTERDGDPTVFDFSSADFGSFDLVDDETITFDDLAPGTYGATEDGPPAGWNLASIDCDNGDTADAVTLAAGDDVTCTFVNEIERGAVVVHKDRKHAADGPGNHPHAGVGFAITNTTNGTNVLALTDASGDLCIEGLPVSALDGAYTVTESLPTGYSNPDLEEDVTVVEGGCADATPATFLNTPLTNITISVDSQIPGGTASTIVCTDDNGAVVVDTTTAANGDAEETVSNLLPTDPTVTLTCAVTVDP